MRYAPQGRCFGCGPKNADGLRIRSYDAGDGTVVTTWQPRPEHEAFEGFVNGERRQHSSTSNLIFSIEFLIEYISFVMTLEPGDVISTGTPSGVGPIVPGDVVTVRVEGVGELSNPVESLNC